MRKKKTHNYTESLTLIFRSASRQSGWASNPFNTQDRRVSSSDFIEGDHASQPFRLRHRRHHHPLINRERRPRVPPGVYVAAPSAASSRVASLRVGGGQVGRTGNGRTIERPCSLSSSSVVAPTRHTKSRRSLKAHSVQTRHARSFFSLPTYLRLVSSRPASPRLASPRLALLRSEQQIYEHTCT